MIVARLYVNEQHHPADGRWRPFDAEHSAVSQASAPVVR
jgi:hypothetical protein